MELATSGSKGPGEGGGGGIGVELGGVVKLEGRVEDGGRSEGGSEIEGVGIGEDPTLRVLSMKEFLSNL